MRKCSIAILLMLGISGLPAHSAEYPEVDKATQSKRDATRLEILTTEKNKELERLATAGAKLKLAEEGGDEATINSLKDVIEQHKVNLAALDTEINKAGNGGRSSIRREPVRIASPKATAQHEDVPYWDTYRRSQAKPPVEPYDYEAVE
ncbi:hypothetical protein FNI39_22005 [Salmonella enterica subsp. indica]|uniref:hypothetical protein n=1 Tax=Salmonella enterica TaxID=28901 RepID=UPI0009AA6CDF|nr:hypothetical protein [Salmonella enterica]EJQ0414107.1 hypothetical protein [Escherichia coli]ECC3879190.1 hypothetical protein [Salmonella enterica subsp. indica]ECF5888652.1 hypothetical protein [Salmonella enterica subsp. indica]EGL5344250.1 hypothetical protein [Salmonella enterica]ELP9190335.1 hypothetical protein [Salmonella enterica]